MAIKFDANGIFRTEVREFMRQNPYEKLDENNLEKLNIILAELESLAVKDRVDGPRNIVGPHFDLTITTEFLEVSMDPPRTAELFFEIHSVFKNHFVPVKIYRTMKMALDEINVQEINPELQVAIDGAISQIREDEYSRRYRPDYCPIVAIRRHNNRGKER